MTIHRLVVDKDLCMHCGNCDFLHSELVPDHLRGPLLRETGEMMISQANLDNFRARIDWALERCFIEALRLEEVD